MSIAEAKEEWSETFEKVRGHQVRYFLQNSNLLSAKVLCHVQNRDIGSARELCIEMLRREELHLFYKVKCNIMLAGFADIPPVARNYFEEAEEQCKQLYESHKPEEEAEILTYQTIIAEGLEDLVPEENQWQLKQGIYISSSDSNLAVAQYN